MADDRWSLLDFMKRVDPNGAAAQIIQLLMEENNLLNTMMFKPTNKELTHQITVQTGLPNVDFVGINEGVDAVLGKTAQMAFGTGFVEARDQIDMNLIETQLNSSSFLEMESMMKMESMAQKLTSTFFNGTLATPKAFVGFTEYYSSLSSNPNNAGFNIIDGGGSANFQSIWLICWGPFRNYGVFPKAVGTSGFVRQFDGMQNATAPNGKTLRVMQTAYKWHSGLVVADWRSTVRIANLDIVELKAEAATGASGSKLVNFLIEAIERIRGVGPKSPNIYMSEEMMTILRKQIINKFNVDLTFDSVAGKQTLMFDGIPIRKVDQLVTEAQVT